ncbi:putative membrane protein [Chlamydia psittaci CP3]|nr:putative membrane protein [Chlamydia psittaci MN]AFS26837.1 putative membrane protein [Chlamydia psittaci CP3]EPJ24867.1 putative membrane protein [Chlamydia psittaci 09DC77]EPJ26301.1 putative membrane protein [Chlamydia psittaci 09DC80]EPJ29721.1 putative membrane protein [Chlamydia psittaci 09DC78]EPL01065.1 putative membrane protein [Chlamydia psittaci 09DC79]KPZ39437.1 membrane protein [Chlamydia psittaci str. Frances]
MCNEVLIVSVQAVLASSLVVKMLLHLFPFSSCALNRGR